mmetsp:Transcript_14085/g.31136  ORF Transcript_14085/g.31136 Transcript_14085/m.31136 type:complete len:214 (+) Transcript_14085:174-815(+)
MLLPQRFPPEAFEAGQCALVGCDFRIAPPPFRLSRPPLLPTPLADCPLTVLCCRCSHSGLAPLPQVKRPAQRNAYQSRSSTAGVGFPFLQRDSLIRLSERAIAPPTAHIVLHASVGPARVDAPAVSFPRVPPLTIPENLDVRRLPAEGPQWLSASSSIVGRAFALPCEVVRQQPRPFEWRPRGRPYPAPAALAPASRPFRHDSGPSEPLFGLS